MIFVSFWTPQPTSLPACPLSFDSQQKDSGTLVIKKGLHFQRRGLAIDLWSNIEVLRLLLPLVIICPDQWVEKLRKMNKTSHDFSLEKKLFFKQKSCQYVLVLSPCPLRMEYFFWFHDQFIFFHQTSIEINELQRNDQDSWAFQ